MTSTEAKRLSILSFTANTTGDTIFDDYFVDAMINKHIAAGSLDYRHN
ncbi:MAG: hypothetical protein BWY75_01783 [bacterium ADurb.Bin425]|nr:MAG: hypothetical protein BWY75_01783 [bacterium ADurb.Bin425]